MNKLIVTLLLLAGSGVFSGCIFGRRAHTTPVVAHTDPVTGHVDTVVSFAPAVPVPLKDSNRIVRIDSTTIGTLTARDTTKTVGASDSATIAVNNIKNQQIATATMLWRRPLQYTTFDGKAKMHYDGGGNSQEFSANFRIKKDSVIWVMVSALGGIVTVARAYITPDSIKVVNYLSKEAILMPISEANRLLPAPVDFPILQNLIIGQPLLGQGTVTNTSDSLTAWIMSITDTRYLQSLSYAKTDTTLQTQQLTTVTPNGPKVTIDLTDYTLEEGRHFPRSKVVHIDNNGNKYQLDMDFTSQSFNHALDFPFSVPRNYTVNPTK